MHVGSVGITQGRTLHVSCDCGWRHEFTSGEILISDPFNEFSEHAWETVGESARHSVINFFAFDDRPSGPPPDPSEW